MAFRKRVTFSSSSTTGAHVRRCIVTFVTLAGAWTLQGCAVLGDACKGIDACQLVNAMGATTVASGMAVDAAYEIRRTAFGDYALHSTSLRKPIGLGRPQSVNQLQSFRGSGTTYDFFRVPTAECPHKHLVVIGKGGKVQASEFGCAKSLELYGSTKGFEIFATERLADDGSIPWAYRIEGRNVDKPREVTDRRFRHHPRYQLYRSAAAGARPTGSGARSEALGRAVPMGAEEAPRTIPQEGVALPDKVEERPAEYERPIFEP